MKAMIMAAGIGTRLMPMTAMVPKPMISLCNRPLMENSIALLQQHGFDQIVANLYYLGETISGYFGDGSGYQVDLHYSWEDVLMGTAGGVRRCADFLDQTFVVLSGDALTDIDLGQLLQRHRASGALASIALKPVEEVEKFGVVVLDEAERVCSFQEKPERSVAMSNLANTGIYIFEPEIFSFIPPHEFYDFGKQVFPNLVQAGVPFYGFCIEDYWCDIGSLDVYRQAHDDVLRDRVRFEPRGELLRYAEGILLLGEDAGLGREVEIRGSVSIGSGTGIGDGVWLEDVVIWNDSAVDSGSRISRSIVGSNCRIRRDTIIKEDNAIRSGSVLGG